RATSETDRTGPRNASRPSGYWYWTSDRKARRSRLRITTVGNAFEQRSGQITLTRIRQHRENDRAFLRLVRDRQRSRKGGARGQAAVAASAAGTRTGSLEGLGVGDRQDTMRHFALQHARDEIRSPALDLVRRERLAR